MIIKCKSKQMHTEEYVNEKKYVNKGFGAGGANTNLFGKLFEYNTNMKDILYKIGFIEKRMNNNKYGYYSKKRINDTEIIYLEQSVIYFAKNLLCKFLTS